MGKMRGCVQVPVLNDTARNKMRLRGAAEVVVDCMILDAQGQKLSPLLFF